MTSLNNSGLAPEYIPLHVIQELTNDFSEDKKIGSGGYGIVYKGIYNGEEFAVKKLKVIVGQDVREQFMSELENIWRLRHENIVRLIAYSYEVKCKFLEVQSRMVLADDIHRALCFEYLQNGSLHNHLYDENQGLDWPTRYKIIKGTCEGLKYLHEGLKHPLLHLDLKPDNILLDKNMVPKLADFGLSKFFTERNRPPQSAEQKESQTAEQKESQQSSLGTLGYQPLEYIHKKEVTEKFDIFSLGVIIIRIMTGHDGYFECNATSARNEAIDRVQGKWRNRLQARAAYTALEEECRQVKTCIEIALDCVHDDPKKRPEIGSIVQWLNETENMIEKLAISLPRESRNDPGSHANKIPRPAPKALVQVNPQELCYRCLIEPDKNMVSSLQLTNMTDDHVAYMFVVSGEVEYSSTRAKGIISPKSVWEVYLNMKAQDASILRHENKVILRSTIVSKDLKLSDITLDMFKQTADRIVDEVKLDVVVAAPTLPQLPVQEEYGKQQSNQEIADPFKMLDVQPIELHFPFERNKLVPCSVHLTNITDKHVAFRLTKKSRERSWQCFVDELPRYGILPPGSIYTLIVTTKKMENQPQKRDYDLILQSCVLGDEHVLPFNDKYECDQFFTEVKMLGGLVREVALKAVSGPQEKPSELAPPGIKILSVENTPEELCCLDTDPIKKWIVRGYGSGNARIWNYETQELVGVFKVSKEKVLAVKFIQRKGWFVAGTSDGYLHVYDYGTKQSKKSWKAYEDNIRSLAVHPAKPYVLSSSDYSDSIKLWNWEEGWEYTKKFKDHSDSVRQLAFNPMDSNIFASASDDHTVKVWRLDSPYPEYTLEGHSKEVTCLDYFSSGGRQYLISGSKDQTAKIWDLQKKMCVQTLDAFWSPLICVSRHPNLPVLITGSKDGICHLWSSSNFSLERVLSIASKRDDVRCIGCLMGSRGVVIGQGNAVSVLTIDNMEFHEASVACNEPQVTAGDTSSEKKPAPSELLDVEPLQLRFPMGLGKLMPCSLKLTNKTDELVAFRLTVAKNEDTWDCFLKLPLGGVVLPRSTYTLVVTTKKLDKEPRDRYFYVILQSTILENQNDHSPPESKRGYNEFFSGVEELGQALHEVTITAEYGQQGNATSEGITSGIKILSVEEPPQRVASLDVSQTDSWIVTGHSSGDVRILDNNTQGFVASFNNIRKPVYAVKFIARKKWIVAGSHAGSIYVYNSEKRMQKTEGIITASTSFITSLSVHPNQPLVLSTANGSPIKLWNWDKQWECIKKFKGHSEIVRQVMFNPVDTNGFASASEDRTVKVWNLDVSDSVSTLEGHSDEVNCLDYFTCGSKQYLITGSKDGTAKIWDLEKKTCVQTLDAFVTNVTSVCSHPRLPLLITASEDGFVHFWSSMTFRLEKTLNIGFGKVVGLGCFEDSQRILIGQDDRLSMIEVDEEPVASKDQEDGEEPIASNDQEDGEAPLVSKDQEKVGEERVASKDQEADGEEPVASKDQEDDEEPVATKKRTKRTNNETKWCFRCQTKGHATADCTTILFCNVCEGDDHVAATCPIKKKPRPVALSVGYAVDGLGFYHIPHGPFSTAKNENNMALIKVVGGELRQAELVAHLEHLVPGKFEWDVQLHAPNTWVTPFPSKIELKRTVNFGSADLKNGLVLKFEEFEEGEYFGKELPRVWMRALNLPKVIRTYEVLWAIGTMFGATTKVDMITTRKSNFGRFEVAVLNASILPTRMDVVIGTRWFELQFEIESANSSSTPKLKENDNGNADDHNQEKGADTEMEAGDTGGKDHPSSHPNVSFVK